MSSESLSEQSAPALTPEFIESGLGFRLAVVFPDFATDRAGLIAYHEELDRFEEQYGADKIFGSLFVENGAVKLGVFVDNSVLPPSV